MRTTARILSLTALLLGLVARASAHDPCGSLAPDLPPGSCHEIRINSFTSWSVAQEFTQRIICPQPNACFQNEVHLPVVIDFDTGTIAIDGRRAHARAG